jgi:hypothetical protein
MSTPALSPPQHKRDHLYLKKKKKCLYLKKKKKVALREGGKSLLWPSSPLPSALRGWRRCFLSASAALPSVLAVWSFSSTASSPTAPTALYNVSRDLRHVLLRQHRPFGGGTLFVRVTSRAQRERPLLLLDYREVNHLCAASAASSYNPQTIAAAWRRGACLHRRAERSGQCVRRQSSTELWRRRNGDVGLLFSFSLFFSRLAGGVAVGGDSLGARGGVWWRPRPALCRVYRVGNPLCVASATSSYTQIHGGSDRSAARSGASSARLGGGF